MPWTTDAQSGTPSRCQDHACLSAPPPLADCRRCERSALGLLLLIPHCAQLAMQASPILPGQLQVLPIEKKKSRGQEYGGMPIIKIAGMQAM